ncbi:MAG: alpha/beta hydrolase [Mycobacterium sp.]
MSVAETAPLDAILQKVLDAVPFQLTLDGGIDATRQRLRELPRRTGEFPDISAEDRVLDVGLSAGVPVRIYRPNSDRPLPVVVFVHGGAFVMGDLDTHDGVARRHAAGADAVVVSVDYRLAPEHPFPAGLDDVWAVTQWVSTHGDELGVDTSRLAVAGDSAGGNLAAVVAQLARDAGTPRIAFQLLWYPATSWDTSLPSYTENASAPILDLVGIAEFGRLYAAPELLDDPPPTLAPARGNVAGLPPAFIGVAGHDPLRDDGIQYADLLAAAAVPVELGQSPSMTHAYLSYAGVIPDATAATDRGLAALRAALHG